MAMFIVINTASLQIIPTTIIAIRTSMNSSNPTGMIIPVWISSLAALICAVSATKILSKKY
jgi:spore maturation protein A